MPRRKQTVPRFTLVADPKSGLWHVSYTDPHTGYTRKRSTGTRDRDEADRRMPAVVSEVMAVKPASGVDYRIGELLEAFERQSCQTKQSGTYYAVQALKLYFHGFKPSQLLNDAVWQNYRTHRTSQNNASAAFRKAKGKTVLDATACRELRTFNGVINWGRRNSWKGLENIAVHIEDEPDYVVQEFLTRIEVQRLLQCCIEPHTRLFVLIALATGARMSAVLELTWDNVHWPVGKRAPHDRGLVATNVQPHPEHDVDFDIEMSEGLRLDMGRGRGNKKRGSGTIALDNIGLYQALKDAWDSRNEKCPYVISYRGKKVGKINLGPAYQRAGLTHYKRRNHLLKHTCCSLLVQSGQTFEAVAKLVGTRAETIRKHYGHLSPEHLQTAARVLSF